MSGSEHHLFALYISSFNSLKQLSSSYDYRVDDAPLSHRIGKVLRLNEGERCILFDGVEHSEAIIKSNDGRKIILQLGDRIVDQPKQPPIEWLLPLLKREAFDESLYTLTEMGITSIQPIVTAKSARSWGSDKDYERARAVMIAAAEQSKQFSIPKIHVVTHLSSWVAPTGIQALFFDFRGMVVKEVVANLTMKPLVCFVGPEGDLTDEEKEMLKAQGFIFCALTDTVLRAKQAIAEIGRAHV